MRSILWTSAFLAFTVLPAVGRGDEKKQVAKETPIWPQWRGLNRDGRVGGPTWPERMSEESLQLLWRIPGGN